MTCRQCQKDYGPFDAIVVAVGATVGCLEEFQNALPLRLCQVIFENNSFYEWILREQRLN